MLFTIALAAFLASPVAPDSIATHEQLARLWPRRPAGGGASLSVDCNTDIDTPDPTTAHTQGTASVSCVSNEIRYNGAHVEDAMLIFDDALTQEEAVVRIQYADPDTLEDDGVDEGGVECVFNVQGTPGEHFRGIFWYNDPGEDYFFQKYSTLTTQDWSISGTNAGCGSVPTITDGDWIACALIPDSPSSSEYTMKLLVSASEPSVDHTTWTPDCTIDTTDSTADGTDHIDAAGKCGFMVELNSNDLPMDLDNMKCDEP